MEKYIPDLMRILQSFLYSIPNTKLRKKIKYDMILLYKNKSNKKLLATLIKDLEPALKDINNNHKKSDFLKLLNFMSLELKNDKELKK